MVVTARAHNRCDIFGEKCEEVGAVGEGVSDYMAGYGRSRLDVGCEEEKFMRDVFLRDDPKEGWKEGLV